MEVGWLDRWMGGWVGGWVDGWINAWLARCTGRKADTQMGSWIDTQKYGRTED